MNSSKNPVATIFSNYNSQAVSILEKFIENGFLIDVVSKDFPKWKKKIKKLKSQGYASTYLIQDYRIDSQVSYIVYVDDFSLYFSCGVSTKAKTLLILPMTVYRIDPKTIWSINRNIGIVYVDRLTNISDLVTKWFLSFGPFGKETVIGNAQGPTKAKAGVKKASRWDLRVFIVLVMLFFSLIGFFYRDIHDGVITFMIGRKIATLPKDPLQILASGNLEEVINDSNSLVKKLYKKDSTLENYLSKSAVLSKELPELLGMKGQRKYLLVFQDDNDLRPTGGAIRSFSVVKIENGNLTDISTSDINSADARLKGRIEPPEAIRKYLGLESWRFRDAGWDPDFSVSAKRMQWFLDKEMDQQVDGVIAVDLASLNTYQANPSSRAIFDLLETKGIQVYSQNQKAQEAILSLGWGGKIPEGVNFIVSAETTIGKSPNNKYISRNTSLEVSRESDLIIHKFTVTFTNSAGSMMGERGEYSGYFRLLTPIKEFSEEVRVLPGRTKKLEFEWSVPRSEVNDEIYIRKHPGTSGDTLTLTVDGATIYNSTLDKDLWIR